MSAPTKEDEIQTYLHNIGAELAVIFNGESRYRIPGHMKTYSLKELLEALEDNNESFATTR